MTPPPGRWPFAIGAFRCEPRSDALAFAFEPWRTRFFLRFTAAGAFLIIDASDRAGGRAVPSASSCVALPEAPSRRVAGRVVAPGRAGLEGFAP